MSAGELREVHLLSLPVQLWAASQEHVDELVREFTLMAAAAERSGVADSAAPARLLGLVAELTGRFAGSADAQRARLFAAAAAGEESIDVVHLLPPAAGAASAQLGGALDAADAYCRTGQHLLTLATPDDLVLFRHWYLQQVVDQLAGEDPVPWPAYEHDVGSAR